MRKKIKYLLLTVLLTAVLMIVSCDRDVTKPDDGVKEVNIELIYNDTDTLFRRGETSGTVLIEEGVHFAEIEIVGGSSLYKLELRAGSGQAGRVIRTLNDPKKGINKVEFSYFDFPVLQSSDPQEFDIKAVLYDTSENTYLSSEVESYVKKAYPYDHFFREVGVVFDIDDTDLSNGRDLRELNGKLSFVQFGFKGCLSCVEEAHSMKEMYEDPDYDTDYFTHSLFGRMYDDADDFRDFKALNKLPFDCFLDEPGDHARTFFSSYTGEHIDTAVLAILPSGEILKAHYGDQFHDWVRSLYNELFSVNK